jgi:hypothetical protein
MLGRSYEWRVIRPQLHETAAALLLVKKPLDESFQSRFALRQAHF